ncbi:uncharacterized protein Dmoj_GI20214 [Drosophila mojavensis]|uniref:Potassium voltage-gated channel subfamily KQT member 1 n=1 Tax=Drosophila mojavensis TaxID=7230 RepID=B4KN74_DROMO|nr:uncharacterized protein Dmoj_GI20214 [Drosophila mojavensis]
MDPENDVYAFYDIRGFKRKCRPAGPNKSQKFLQPRMSLLGKPLNYNRGTHRRDARYRRMQSRLYNFLERPRGLHAIFYHVMVFLMVFTCLALSVFSTIKEYEEDAVYILFRMEIIVVIWFTMEFGARLWSSGCRSRYQGTLGRLKFIKQPFCIIDIITILASIVVLGMGTSGQVFATSALRGLRFFQILRMVRMDRRGGTWKLLGSVVYAHRQELITTMYIGFLGLIFASFLVYMWEKDVNEKFSNFAQALWWGVITLCTVGYGDMVPITWQGKLIASCCALLGISFFALPAVSLSLIHALDTEGRTTEYRYEIRASSSFKHNTSFVARLPTIRRHKSQTIQAPGPDGSSLSKPPGSSRASTRYTRTIRDINASVENLEVVQNGKSMNPSFSEDSVAETTCLKNIKNSDDEDEEPRCTQLTNRHKIAIRFIRKLKYFVARRKFKEALKPYDVKDVMEQYAAGHVDLLGRVKMLHLRLDQILGKQGSKAKDVYASKISLASRVVKVERQVVDIEEKLDILIKAYMEDRDRFLALPLPANPKPKIHSISPSHSHSLSHHTHNQNMIDVWKRTATLSVHPELVTTPTGSSDASALDHLDGNETALTSTQTLTTTTDAIATQTPMPHTQHTATNTKSSVLNSYQLPPEQQQHNDVFMTDLENRTKKRVTLSLHRSTSEPYSKHEQRINMPDEGAQSLDSSAKPTPPDSSIILIDEYEDFEEEDLNCEGEMEHFPSWEIDSDIGADVDVDADGDCDESTEDTALLQCATRTAIVITPISPVSSALNLQSLNDQTTTLNKSNLLPPDSG